MIKKSFILGVAALAYLSGVTASDADHSNIHLSASHQAELEKSRETMTFQTEITRMMDIIINSLYTNRDVFIRELISNASDALEKARYKAISEGHAQEAGNLEVRVEFDLESKTITFTDSGVGMTRADLINNLGTLAKSGTTNFLEAVAGGNDLSLIGQFGVGFYSCYLVADRVTVVSKNDNDDQYIWESSATSEFTVAKDPRGNTLNRGTQIILHLKEDATEYMDEAKIRQLVDRYSQFISFPIKLLESVTKTEEVEDEENIDEETNLPKKKTVEHKELEWTQLNTQKALWLREKGQISDDDYTKFYENFTKDIHPPLSHTHFNAEGEIDFKALLYIPSKAPQDMFENYYAKNANIRLYVRRVLVGDSLENMLPRYLHFIRGIVDSDDLPLNVAREQLQQSRAMKNISKTLVRKVFELLTKLSKDSESEKAKLKEEGEKEGEKAVSTYDKFYKEFSKSLKMGCYEDDSNRNKIMKLMRFHTSKHKDDFITLDEYFDSMKESQDVIYFIAGESNAMLDRSPHMQAFLKRNIDVLYLTESMDEPCITKAGSYRDKKFVSIQKGDIKFDDSDLEKRRFKKLQTMYEPLTKWLTNHFKSKVSKVDISQRLVDHPLTVVSSPYGYSSQMEKVLKSQAFSDFEQMKFLMSLRNLEINPNHPIMIDLLEKVKKADGGSLDEGTTRVVDVLFHTATVAAGFEAADPTELASQIYSLITKDSLGKDPHAKFEEVDVGSLDEDEPLNEETADETTPGEDFNYDDDIDQLLNNQHDEL